MMMNKRILYIMLKPRKLLISILLVLILLSTSSNIMSPRILFSADSTQEKLKQINLTFTDPKMERYGGYDLLQI